MKKEVLRMYPVLIFFMMFPLPVEAGAPLDTIRMQINKVLEILQDPSLKGELTRETKKQKIWSTVNSIFDYNQLSRRTLGRNWKKMTPGQRKEFTDLFSKLLSSVYMDRILDYSDEKVVFGKENILSKSRVEVQSKVVTASKEIPIHYRMFLKNGTWKVYDVHIEGVSLIMNYRSQFKSILTNKSIEDLLKMLRKKVGAA